MIKPQCFLPLLFCWVVPCFAWFTPQAIYKNLYIFILVASNLHHQLCLVKTLYAGKKPGFPGFPVDFPSSPVIFAAEIPWFSAPRSWLQRRGCATSRRSWAMWTARCDAVPRSGTPENGGLFLGNPMKMDDSEIPHRKPPYTQISGFLSGWNFGPSSYAVWPRFGSVSRNRTDSMRFGSQTVRFHSGSVWFHGTEPKACSVRFVHGSVLLWVSSVSRNRKHVRFGS